ncbi:MAG: OB-fold domain-containing protein [Deltaproteobacteria bacterium]|nr:OB-fold domain-containing protein [Deltaproteobacteria bacterium]
MAKIASFGAYIPLFRLAREKMGEAWGIPAAPGERAVANADEDSLTMAMAAGADCLAGIDPSTVDGLYFATTTAPYDEKQCAGIIAAALDMRTDINTADFTGSLRAATTALRAAADAVDSGSARSILVVAADCRLGEPESLWEQMLGDAAGAVLISKQGLAVLRGFTSVAGDQIGVWRRGDDRYIRSFEGKAETQYGYVKSAEEAGKSLLAKEKVAPGSLTHGVFTATDPRASWTVADTLGVDRSKLQDTMFMFLGYPGTPLVLMMLAGALEGATGGDKLLVINNGDGADAFLVELEKDFPSAPARKGLAGHLAQRRDLPTYTAYAGFRKLMKRDEADPRGSAVTYWRDTNIVLNWHGGRCRKCGAVQYPIPRVCGECATKDQIEEVKLAKSGSVYTFTLDHLDAGKYVNVPVPRLVLDLAGGGRVFLSMTDGDPQDVKIGMTAEIVFRRLHDASSFHNYYWKCRPVPGAAA